MGLFSQIFGRSRPRGLYRSEMQHLTNRVDQVSRNKERIVELRENGISDSEAHKLIIYFTTDTEEKALDLIAELQRRGYNADWEPPKEDFPDYLVKGNTDEISMSEEVLSEWTNLMCDLAAKLDCEFADWTIGHPTKVPSTEETQVGGENDPRKQTTPIWRPFNQGRTIGTRGSEDGRITHDEEHDLGARITLEMETSNAPFSVTCGIYESFMHTSFSSTLEEALEKYFTLKDLLVRTLNEEERFHRSGLIDEITNIE